MIVEAWLVSVFGTTGGKKILGIYVFNRDGEKLSFFLSLKRAFLFFGIGMGFFLPYVSLILPLFALFWRVRKKSFLWDMLVPDEVKSVKTTLLDKLLLIGFIVFMALGYFMTARAVLLYKGTDFAALENQLLEPYFEKIRPQLIQVLSEESVLSVQAAEKTMASLRVIQGQMQYQREEILLLKELMQKQIDKMPDTEWKRIRQNQTEAFFDDINGFLFAESMRIGLFENIVEFFTSAEKNKYTVTNGVPVFEDKEMKHQYDNYMMQLEAFLSLGMAGEN